MGLHSKSVRLPSCFPTTGLNPPPSAWACGGTSALQVEPHLNAWNTMAEQRAVKSTRLCMHADYCHVRAADLYFHSLDRHPLQPELAVHTATKQLLPVHESIIIGSPGLWDLVSPAACALRAHFYLRASSQALVCSLRCSCRPASMQVIC